MNSSHLVCRGFHFALIAWASIGLWSPSAITYGDDRITPIKSVGNADHLWIYRTVPDANSKHPGVTFAYGQSLDSGLRFRGFRGGEFGGYIAASAIRGDNLHVFYRDGSHYRLRFVQRVASELPRDDDFPELTAPGDVVPLAVYGDTESDAVYAIVATRSVLDLPLHIQPANEASTDVTTNGQQVQKPIATAASVIDMDQPPPLHSLVRYHRGAWQFVTLCPVELESASFHRLAAGRDSFAILFASSEDDSNLKLSFGTLNGWQPPARGPNISPSNVIGFLNNRKVYTVVSIERTDDTIPPIVKAHQWLDGVWKAGEPFQFDLQESQTVGTEIAATRYGEDIALAFEATSEGSTSVWSGVWPPSGGAPSIESAEVTPLRQKSAGSAASQNVSIAIAIMLSALLFVVFVRRTPSLFVEMETPPGYTLAGFGKRASAFSIDLFVVALVAVPLFVTPWITANFTPGDDFQRELSYLLETDPNAAFAPWAKVLLLFVAYSMAMELAFRATIGKLALGLQVCSTSGKPCSSLSVIVRNLLRFELYYKGSFLPLAMLVILTRNHQRLGDLVAGTLVVERQKTAPTPQNDSQ